MVEIIRNKAEEKLLLALQDQIYSNPTGRCLLLRFSQIACDHQALMPDLLSALENITAGDLGKIFICHDDDVFLIDQNLTYHAIEQLYTHLTPQLLPAVGDHISRLASLFDIGIEKNTLLSIIGRKLESRRNANWRQRGDHKKNFFANDLVLTMEDSMMNSLAERRKGRRETEVLVAEDDAFSRMLVSMVLDGRYSLKMAADGQAALVNYVRAAPDIVFLDIGLPDMDGHQILEHIFEIDPEAYVVMFSGHGDVHNVTKAMELGAQGFLSKPFTKEKLLRFIEKSPYVQAKQGNVAVHS